MPWYKLFDEQVEPKQLDDILRLNVYEANGIPYTWFPQWVADEGQFTQDIINKAYELGPYYCYGCVAE